MGCETVSMPGGGTGIICGGRGSRRRCKFCRRAADLACDWPKPGEPPCAACGGSGKAGGNPDAADCHDCLGTGTATCSAAVCASCRRVKLHGERKQKLDVCPACAAFAFADDRRPVLRDTAPCDGCPARVLWARNVHTQKPGPIAAPPEGVAGNVRVWHADRAWFYEVLGKAAAEEAREAGERLYLNHFADCAAAERFKR